MKDDVDWPEDYDITSLERVSIGLSRVKRHKTTLRALRYLMQLELEMLREIQEQLFKPGDSKIAQLYVSKFSAAGITKGKNEVLFTRHMFDEYFEYLKWSKSFPAYSKALDDEKDIIYQLLDSYSDTRRAFK